MSRFSLGSGVGLRRLPSGPLGRVIRSALVDAAHAGFVVLPDLELPERGPVVVVEDRLVRFRPDVRPIYLAAALLDARIAWGWGSPSRRPSVQIST